MSAAWTVGVDFGGTNIKVGLVDRRGRVAQMVRLSTHRAGKPDTFVPAISRTARAMARSVGVRSSELLGIGIGAPGLVDASRGIVHYLVNVPGWRRVPLATRLRRRVGCPVAVDNDVNLVALGEWCFGAGRGSRHLVCVTLGTGIGGGLIIGPCLYRGASGSAGELGHMVLAPGGPRCGCGRRGCLEASIGTRAILRQARAAMRHGAPRLRRLVRAGGGKLTSELVARAAASGDPTSRRIWREVGASLGTVLASVVNLMNPDRIVIGGGVANAWRFLAPGMTTALRAHAMDVPARAVKVVCSQLAERAGMLGAAVLVWQHIEERSRLEAGCDATSHERRGGLS